MNIKKIENKINKILEVKYQRYFAFPLYIKRKTEKAVLAYLYFETDEKGSWMEEVWIPNSQLRDVQPPAGIGRGILASIPAWLKDKLEQKYKGTMAGTGYFTFGRGGPKYEKSYLDY